MIDTENRFATFLEPKNCIPVQPREETNDRLNRLKSFDVPDLHRLIPRGGNQLIRITPNDRRDILIVSIQRHTTFFRRRRRRRLFVVVQSPDLDAFVEGGRGEEILFHCQGFDRSLMSFASDQRLNSILILIVFPNQNRLIVRTTEEMMFTFV